jgi:6-phosphogluconolactonase
MAVATGQVIVARDESAFFRRAVDLFVVAARKAERPSVALSGGSTPKKLFEQLASPAVRAEVTWERMNFFFGDERCVPPDHKDSNYRMAHEALLSKVPVPAAQVHRMAGEMEPSRAASAYEAELRRAFSGLPLPRFDLVLLGIGEDGHTASLFPGTPALDETARWVVANHVDQLDTDRLTLTFPVINAARRIVILATGAPKTDIIQAVFSGAGRYPVERVSPTDGELIWLLDAQAGQKLPAAVRSGATYI